MNTENEKRYFQVIACLPDSIKQRLLVLSSKLCISAQEIRLRINRPLTVVCPDITYFVTQSGGIVSTMLDSPMLTVTKSDISDTFQNICNYSVYAKQNEIANGFVTMQGGHRAGICGTAVINGDKIINIRDISSINIRIAREHKNCASQLVDKLSDKAGGVLICGAPCSGKTTVLRDIARLMSVNDNRNIALIDERGELAGTVSGKFQNDIGLCDVYDGYKKSTAMLHAIRSMAPDIIICDEIGSDDDIYAVEKSVNCGVRIIASVHTSGVYELKHKDNIRRLIKTGAFSTIVFLSDKHRPGEVVKISEVGEIFGN